MQELLAADTRQPVERIVRDVNRDFWMSAEDALACGIIETVIGQTEKVLAADPAEPGSGHRWSSIAATVQRQLQVVPVRVPGHLIDSIILTSDFRFLVAPRLAGSEVLVVGGVPNGRSGAARQGFRSRALTRTRPRERQLACSPTSLRQPEISVKQGSDRAPNSGPRPAHRPLGQRMVCAKRDELLAVSPGYPAG
jgi:hypothetical protein